MKRFFTFLSLMMGIFALGMAQSDLPKFSTAENPIYFLVKFKNGNGYLQDNGANQQLVTETERNTETQLFAFIGEKDNFVMLSKRGNYVGMKDGKATNGVNGKFFCAVTDRTKATELAIIEGQSNGYFEITKAADKANGMNQWGGGGDNRSLGLWKKGDPNNPLSFIDPNEISTYAAVGVKNFAPERQHTLWYDKPATLTKVANIWMEYSLPIGNGQLGASLFGGIKIDEIQFNEKTLWRGTPNDMGGYGKYMNFGSVLVKNLADDIFSTDNSKPAKNYVRFLDIERGVGGVNFEDTEGTQYTRRYIASEPAGVIVAYYKAEGTNKLNLLFSVAPGEQLGNTDPVYAEDGSGTFHGKLETVFYNSRFKVVNIGGTLKHSAKGIEVNNADAVMLVLGGATSFDNKVATRTSGNAQTVAEKVKTLVETAAEKKWDVLFKEHVDNFESYMGRVSLNINNAASGKTTEALIKYYNQNLANKNTAEGLFLEQLYFNYGRYLGISSSRGASVPNNLQGIWNDKANAPWNSDIHTNINVQMNYWPMEPTNLSELHLPLLDYIIDNAQSANWKRAASQYGKQNKGWTVFTESNIFGGMSTWGNNYFVANAWYCSHLWQHYRYTLDKEFLKRAFPAMWGSAQFWMGRMIKDKGSSRFGFAPDGTWVCPDEYSAEQNDHPKEDGTAHAQQLVTENLMNCLQAINVLGMGEAGVTADELASLESYLKTIDKGLHIETYKGDWGGWASGVGIKTGDKLLKEWKYAPYSISKDKGHRHMSHLMCLYPLSQVEPGDGFFEAAVNSLKLRGDEATGWSMGWKVNLWARAKDGNHAHKIIRNALKHSTAYETNQYAGGVYYNLYDSHAPFQIDGNFGVCAGISEMLLQSHRDIIEILPALPTAWKSGSVNGLKAIGDFTVSIEWKNGKASKVKIVSNKGQLLRISTKENLAKVEVLIDGKAAEVVTEELKGNAGELPVFQIKNVGMGQTVTIDFDKITGIATTPFETQKETEIYDLSGRRTDARAKGIVISQGKKIMQ